MVIDREKVLAVLLKRFPCASAADLAAAANAIVGLTPEYTELQAADLVHFECEARARHYSACHVATGELRLYRRGPRATPSTAT
jgi:hypothetical protein